MTERVFGNKTEFGIKYVSGWKSQDSKYYFGKLHLLLNGQIIGDKNETCLIGTWISSMEDNLTLIENNSDRFYHPEFDKRTDEEIFELIYKSNQLPNEFNKHFIDLPVLSNEIWQYCNLSIDETIDAYLITMICESEILKFIWKGFREPCLEEQINILHSISVEKDLVANVINECLKYVKNDIKTYKIKMTS